MRIRSSGLPILAAVCLAASAGMAQPDGVPTPPPARGGRGAAPTYETSVVKVISSMRLPDLARPWAKQGAVDQTGSGVVIAGKRILTNAHIVAYSNQVQIQTGEGGDKIAATIEAIAPGIDLAVLKLADESFFDTHPALSLLTSFPGPQDSIALYGFPPGATTASLMRRTSPHTDFGPYNFPVSGMRTALNTPIEPDFSGGPALVGNRIVGLTFSRMNGTTATAPVSYIIPAEEIELFLKDIPDGKFDRKPILFDEFQTMESPALRAFLKLDASVQGVVVRQPANEEASYPLKMWDVVTRIANTPIDNQGMVRLPDNSRVRFLYLIQKQANNGIIPMTVIRAGKPVELEVPVSTSYPKLIPFLKGSYPDYFILGPVVFSSATEDLIAAMMSGTTGPTINTVFSNASSPLITRRGERAASEGESLVVIPSPMFPHPLSEGYTNPIAKVVKAVNGHPVKNLGHLVQWMRDSKDDFISIEFAGHNTEALVFPRKEMIAATDTILADNGIRSQGSPDMMAIWNGK